VRADAGENRNEHRHRGDPDDPARPVPVDVMKIILYLVKSITI
jgi:hypothetical protein